MRAMTQRMMTLCALRDYTAHDDMARDARNDTAMRAMTQRMMTRCAMTRCAMTRTRDDSSRNDTLSIAVY